MVLLLDHCLDVVLGHYSVIFQFDPSTFPSSSTHLAKSGCCSTFLLADLSENDLDCLFVFDVSLPCFELLLGQVSDLINDAIVASVHDSLTFIDSSHGFLEVEQECSALAHV